ncbi:hypothetical protein BJ875DRAFT_372587 [Amylocarpus encephaloides]|uniref:LsmAD domain-containing protein n=1 Tax=Amylocarpus encephaloides TaxID=45428 RepID=A0A9P8C7C8_9HELO|nr:hypothetical protein BJ875DRAFT_372587 [Amylocarpus encephaloides]
MPSGAKYQSNNMAYQRKDTSGGLGKTQNGNAASFRTDAAISGSKAQGERVLQKFVFDAPEDSDGSLESSRTKSHGPAWDQFAENERRFGLKTDYDENIYTTAIDRSHPQYKQRAADADRKAREIEQSVTTNSHVAEERIIDNLARASNGLNEEEKYSGVRRQADFPPLASSNNSTKYTPPARRAPASQSTISSVPVDPAIISSQLARPDKHAAEKKASPTPKAEVATPPTTCESSVTATPETKPSVPKAGASTGRTVSPQVKAEGIPNATATVERDVATAFKTFATQQRNRVETARATKAKNDKELKLSDLKKFANTFKLNTPVPTDLISIIAKDPAKQKDILEKANRNAEEAKSSPSEVAKPLVPPSETRSAAAATRPPPANHGASPSNLASRQAPNRTPGFAQQQGLYNPQQFRGDRTAQGQQAVPQQNRGPGNLGARLRNIEQQKHGQMQANMPGHEARLPPTGPSDPNFSRRSSGVASVQGRLNPNSSEFRPSPHAASFNPNGKTSNGSSPRSAANAVEPAGTPPATRSLLKRKPMPGPDRPSLKEAKFDALGHIMTIKPAPGRDWQHTGGVKPAYDTPLTWRQLAIDEDPTSTMHLTYTKMFEMTPFPTQAMSPSNPSHAVPQVPHQHQLPFHLQQGVHGMNQRQSPRQPSMNLPGNHGHGPTPPFNGPDDHRMMTSQSQQSFTSPRLPHVPIAFPSPSMTQPAQLTYNAQMMQYPGGPPMQNYRSLSQGHAFMPQQPHMGPPVMMQSPAGGFMTSQGIAPGPQVMYPPGQPPFMPQGNGHPPTMPVNGYPSPGRGAPMMMSQGSQQGHQQQPAMYGMNHGVNLGPQYQNATPIYAQQPPGQSKPSYGWGLF